MLDLLRRHVVILTSVAMGWSAYGFYDSGSGKPEALAKGSLAEIAPEYLAVRDTSIPLAIANDPYRLDGLVDAEGQPIAGQATSPGKASASTAPSAGGRSPAPAARAFSQADLLLAFTGALRAVAHETHDLFAGPAPVALPAAAGVGAGAAPANAPPRGFTLLLQSTLDMASGGQARINGRTVAEGDAMLFLDPLDPPVLRQVQGTSVVVSYAGQLYTADLLESPLLQVGQPVVAVAPAAGPKPSATSAPKSAPAGTAAPTTNPTKPKGTYRVRGNSTKKKP